MIQIDYYKIKRKFLNLIELFHEKGIKKISIMYMYHNQARTREFQINWYFIYFLLFLFTIMFSMSLYSIIKKNIEITRIKEIYGYNMERILSIQKRNKQNINYAKKLIENLKEINQMVGINKKYTNTFNTNVNDSLIENKLNESVAYDMDIPLSFKFIPPVYSILALQQMFDNNRNLLITTQLYPLSIFNMYSQIPLGRPIKNLRYNQDNSRYGWRRNPMRKYSKNKFNKRKHEFHSGLDMGSSYGTPIYATADGIVVQRTFFRTVGYGFSILIKHGFHYYSMYAHLSRIYVKHNQKVKKGDLIGRFGKTGKVTGTHLHYEIRLGNSLYDKIFRVYKTTDPLPFICATDLFTKNCIKENKKWEF